MTDGNVTELPLGDIDIDLDALEKPAEEQVPPFAAKIGGKRIVFRNPDELDYQDLALIDSPIDFIEYVLDDKDRDHIRSIGIPGWKLNKLMEQFMEHYGLDEKLKQAEREQARAARRLR